MALSLLNKKENIAALLVKTQSLYKNKHVLPKAWKDSFWRKIFKMHTVYKMTQFIFF